MALSINNLTFVHSRFQHFQSSISKVVKRMQKLQATTTASSLTSCPLNDQPTGAAATPPPPSAAIQCRSRSSRCSKDLESKNQVRSWMGVGKKEGTRRKGRTIAAPTAVAKPARARLRRRRAGGELR